MAVVLPSVYLFGIWNAYVETVELDKLYNEELVYFLAKRKGGFP